ncbi:MAG: lysophospholipid acyltransferase family protein [Anaerolineales bacterium]|jgi:1-acyl-sn-glycerol-3-phosphate acyltransferase
MLSEILYSVSRIMIKSYARLLLNIDIHWRSSLPAGPVLFAANHPSTTDPLLIHLISKKPMSVMIHSKVFSIPLLGAYMRIMEQICVNPGQGEKVLEQARQTLKAGRSVTIFPEGLISPAGGGFNPPRSGVGRLALSSGVPVIPIGIYLSDKGCHRIPTTFDGEPDIVTWYLHGPYAITIGKALHFRGDANDRDFVKKVTETIMQSIRALALDSQKRICPVPM